VGAGVGGGALGDPWVPGVGCGAPLGDPLGFGEGGADGEALGGGTGCGGVDPVAGAPDGPGEGCGAGDAEPLPGGLPGPGNGPPGGGGKKGPCGGSPAARTMVETTLPFSLMTSWISPSKAPTQRSNV